MNKAIGFFDSGMGGISVLREAVRLMPDENFIYYGDSANAPYGERSEQEIYNLTMSAVSYLISNDIKALVIACNTATAVAVERIRAALSIPVIGMEPAVKPALEHTDGNVLVMATPATIHQQRYNKLIDTLGQKQRVINLPCDKLAYLVERCDWYGAEMSAYLDAVLEPYIGKVDAAVLGCTHYVFIRDIIEAKLGSTVKVFDGNVGTVSHLRDILETNGLLSNSNFKGTVVLNSSSDDQFTLKTYAKLLKS